MRSVTSQIVTDPRTNDQVMRIRFVVHARDKDEEWTYFQRARDALYRGATWTQNRMGDWYDDVLDRYDEYIATHSSDPEIVHKARQSQSRRRSSLFLEQEEGPREQVDKESWYHVPGRWLGGAFSSFVGLTRGAGEVVRSATRAQEPGTWTTGEVHGELRMVRSLLNLTAEEIP